MPHLRCEIEKGLATIVLNNPPQNRLAPQMIDELCDIVDFVGRSEARAALLRAEGPDFSFGGDIVPWPAMSARELRTLFQRYLSAFNEFERMPIPTVAAVQGLCFGGGLELAVRADVIFAGASARFGHPEQSIAVVTLLGGIYRIAERAGRSRAIEWALTSEQVPAPVMERYGVVNRVVEDNRLIEEATAFATRLAKGPTRARAAHKSLLRTWATGGIAAADEAIFDIAIPLFDTEDVKWALPLAIEAFTAGKPRPVFDFKGR
jgi:enoyl-CoA hydratase/carnithine racemase